MILFMVVCASNLAILSVPKRNMIENITALKIPSDVKISYYNIGNKIIINLGGLHFSNFFARVEGDADFFYYVEQEIEKKVTYEQFIVASAFYDHVDPRHAILPGENELQNYFKVRMYRDHFYYKRGCDLLLLLDRSGKSTLYIMGCDAL